MDRRHLESRLFECHGRGVRLTPAGEALLEPARRSLRSFQLARGALRAVSEAGFGRLYYVRVFQVDGEMAWSSPIWVDHVPS
jgi:DNA-binding transcriptional LysR family regulator